MDIIIIVGLYVIILLLCLVFAKKTRDYRMFWLGLVPLLNVVCLIVFYVEEKRRSGGFNIIIRINNWFEE